ncbi:MAG: putative acetyltransferase [Frankiales bacterium]|nr:putative acetyltransferase [Frankiales bacterium]
MLVRPAVPQEHARIGELTASTYLTEGFADHGYAEHLRDVATRAAHATVLVALVDDEVVGSLTVATQGGDVAEGHGPGTAVIRMLVTAPAARGRGVGKALVEGAIAAAREDHCEIVRLSTMASMTAAHRLYEGLGFTRTPDRDWEPEPGLELLTYALPLTVCALCGEPGVHPAHIAALELEPPRYCVQCGRRMVVQVHPTGWTATCVEHGLLVS